MAEPEEPIAAAPMVVTSAPARGTTTISRYRAPRDRRRILQVLLGAAWVTAGALQYQPFFFSRGFSRTILAAALHNPLVIARPMTFSAHTIGHYPVPADGVFATAEVLLGLAIAWRPTCRWGLAGSAAWGFGVWWIWEGLDGIFHGGANLIDGSPGAALAYVVLAVMLWPSERAGKDPPFIAARAVGVRAAQAVWLVLWGYLTYAAVSPFSRSPRGLQAILLQTANREPGWLASVNRHGASWVGGRGATVSIVLAGLLGFVAVSVLLPRAGQRAGVALVLLLLAASWVATQDFGGIFAGGATDPGTAVPLALLALAYWPGPVAADAWSRLGTVPAYG